ncbi:MAG: SAM-dependent methyltransferase [Acidobacteriota bacterium]
MSDLTTGQTALTDRVAEHYDTLSFFYRELWGNHIHHGYYHTGSETKEEAAENLLELLTGQCGLQSGSRVLDVGCGVGGSCTYLVEKLHCWVVGVTVSAVQAQMARRTSLAARHLANYVVADACRLPLRGSFDAILALEVLSHLEDRRGFFEDVTVLLSEGGRIGIAAWLKNGSLNERSKREIIEPIEAGMLVRLPTAEEYRGHFQDNGLKMSYYLDISSEVQRTWDLCLDIIKDRALWSMAVRQGREVVNFLRAFRAMKRGYSTGAFRYSLLVAEK